MSSAAAAVYTSGDLILENPVEATTIFLFVILVSAMLEFGIDSADNIQNKYFKVMFNALNQEIMIVGVLVLSLTFAETVYDWPSRWILLFKWSMMCLFLMAIIFVTLIMSLLLCVRFTDRTWTKFEAEKMDSGEPLGARETQYKDAFNKFQFSLRAFGYDASMGIQFSQYISKLQRRNVVALTDLTWVSWVCLGTLVILNALRAEATRRISEFGDENIEDEMSDQQRALNYISFILIVGYGTLVVFMIIYFKLTRRLNKFLKTKRGGGDGVGAAGGGGAGGLETALQASQDLLDDSKAYLFRRSTEATLEIVQVIILFLEWYIATFFLSYAYQITANLGGIAVPLFIFALLPAMVVIGLLPWLLMVITMLSALGNNLDEATVMYLVRKSGIPEEEWPPQMRPGNKRAMSENNDDDDVVSRTVVSSHPETIVLGRGLATSHMDPQSKHHVVGNAAYNVADDRRKAMLDSFN